MSIRLVQDDGRAQERTIRGLDDHYQTCPLEFEPSDSSDNARIEILGSGEGAFRVGTVSLMPSDHQHGWRSDTVGLLKELDSPICRWLGGNFVSGYDWRDGIGDRGKRPPLHDLDSRYDPDHGRPTPHGPSATGNSSFWFSG